MPSCSVDAVGAEHLSGGALDGRSSEGHTIPA